jgi:anti-sigma regulatory factor (Ser/Thr protein kinase)
VAPDDVVSVAVPADPEAVPPARAFVKAALQGWEMPADLVRDAVLLATELVANAIVHGRAPIELRVRRGAVEITLEVDDGATVLPRKLRLDPEDEHGRGLQLVAIVADRWGTRPLRDGKTVWCVLPVARYLGGAQPNVNA